MLASLYKGFSSTFRRSITMTPALHATALERFDGAKAALDKLGPEAEPSNDIKLQMYGLFKQATVGPCNTKKPGMMDFVGKAKWEAWNSLGAMGTDDAMGKYADIVSELAKGAEKTDAGSDAVGTADDAPIVVKKEGSVLTIRLNRPKKFNALTRDMYNTITTTLNATNNDPSVKVTVLTGTGDYFCSGNDLSMFTDVDPSDPASVARMAEKGRKLLLAYVASYIDHTKPLIALVNGPAVGISVTVLGLCDAVYAVDTATFQTPFPQVGQTPEGCSSYTFPLFMGYSKASEVLLGRKLTAQEAFERNLVTRVLPKATFEKEAWGMVQAVADLPPQSVQCSKGLVRFSCKEHLHKVNEEECRVLEDRWQSQECAEAVMKFFMRKSKG